MALELELNFIKKKKIERNEKRKELRDDVSLKSREYFVVVDVE
jgi:hypothetical protein